MKKKVAAIISSLIVLISITGCSQADRVSSNLAKEADNFNVIRQVTVINCIANDTMFQMTGKMSIKADTTDNQLELVVENEDGTYAKGIIGLSNNVSYIVSDLDSNYVDKYKFTINYNPKMWLPPIQFETIE